MGCWWSGILLGPSVLKFPECWELISLVDATNCKLLWIKASVKLLNVNVPGAHGQYGPSLFDSPSSVEAPKFVSQAIQFCHLAED